MRLLENAVVKEKQFLSADVFKLKLETERIAETALPGQFLNVYLNASDMLLPRPISICDVDGKDITLVIQMAGKGTEYLSKISVNDRLKIMGGLGNGFLADAHDFDFKDGNVVLIGGGIGIAPLIFLSKTLSEKYDVYAYLGYRSKAFLYDDFKKHCKKVFVSSDTGEAGMKGNVLELYKKNEVSGAAFVCGPDVMARAVSSYLPGSFISLEERMACGFGVCVGCAVSIMTTDGIKKLKVCSDGPVFRASDIVWKE